MGNVAFPPSFGPREGRALQEKIRTFLQGCRRKRYSHGMNMIYQEFCAILEAWPTSSQLPDEVILLDYEMDPFTAIVFCTNFFLETSRLIFEECQRSCQVPWCWLDGPPGGAVRDNLFQSLQHCSWCVPEAHKQHNSNPHSLCCLIHGWVTIAHEFFHAPSEAWIAGANGTARALRNEVQSIGVLLFCKTKLKKVRWCGSW